jgi:hypothetical protein
VGGAGRFLIQKASPGVPSRSTTTGAPLPLRKQSDPAFRKWSLHLLLGPGAKLAEAAPSRVRSYHPAQPRPTRTQPSDRGILARQAPLEPYPADGANRSFTIPHHLMPFSGLSVTAFSAGSGTLPSLFPCGVELCRRSLITPTAHEAAPH